MHRRKIQLIAGTTYSVSLPKEWVLKNRLRAKSEVLLHEKNDRTLVVSPSAMEEKKLNDISLEVDEYGTNIYQVLFALYYIGVENITLFSRKELGKDTKARIRKTLTFMSGTVIGYEDKQKITIKVLLDRSKISMDQLLYRISLIIDLSMTNMLEKLDLNEIKINENEIDRYYHLIAKIVSLALIDSSVLHSSGIQHVSLIPAYFLIGKRLENIGDNINHLAEYVHQAKEDLGKNKQVLDSIRSILNQSIRPIMQKFPKSFEKTGLSEIKRIHLAIGKIKDRKIADYLKDIVRYLVDIEEEIVNISFYNKLIKDNLL